jgi:hypothetical protein
MGLFSLVLVLICVLLLTGAALALGNWVGRRFGFDATIMKIMNFSVIIIVLIVITLYICSLFGILPLHDIPIRSLR